MSPSSRAAPFILAGFTSSDFPDVEAAILPKGKPKSRLSSTSATRTPQPVETGASSSGAAMAQQPAAAGGESVSAFLRRGPPKIQRLTEAPDQRKIPGESDQEHKCRLAGERYSTVVGETEAEAEMVDFFKQVLAAASRGVITSFALSIIESRYWGVETTCQTTRLW